MLINKSHAGWQVGSTSFNVSQKESSIWVKTYLEAMHNFNLEHPRSSSTPFSTHYQEKFFEFCKEKYPILSRNNVDTKASVRKKKAWFTNSGLLNPNATFTKYGDLIYSNNEIDPEIQEIADKTNLSYVDICFFVSLLSKKFKSKIKYWEHFFNSLINNKEITLKAFYVSRYASTETEFKKILSMSDKNIDNYLFKIMKDNNLTYIKNRKTSKKEEEFKTAIINSIRDFRENKYTKKELEIRKAHHKSSLCNSKKAEYKKFISFFYKFDPKFNIEDEKLFNMGRQYTLWCGDGYRQQLKIFADLIKLFYIEDGKILPTKNLLAFKSIKSFSNKEYPFSYEIKYSGIEIEKGDNSQLYEYLKFSRERDMITDLLDKDYFLNEDYPEELRKEYKYIYLEYFITLRLMDIFNLPFEKVTNMTLYENGLPKSHAPGKMPDFFLEDHNLIFEVTTSFGRNTEKLEIEPVPRHVSKQTSNGDRDIECIFLSAEPISPNIYNQFIRWREDSYYIDDNKWINMKIMTVPLSKAGTLLRSKENLRFFIDKINLLDEEALVKIKNKEWKKIAYEEKRNKIFQNK